MITPLGCNWKREFAARWQITFHTTAFDASLYLWTTRCSQIKSTLAKGTPKELYRAPLNLYFYRQMEALGFNYGILSDRYGLHMDDELKATYNIHPSLLSLTRKKELGRVVRDKVLSRGFRGVIFYNNSPLRSVPYLQILAYSQVPTVFTTKIELQANLSSSPILAE